MLDFKLMYDGLSIRGVFARATLPNGVVVDVMDDDEPYDWGDIEPTSEDRADLSVIGVRAYLPGTDFESSIWGVGFTDFDWERAANDAAYDYCLPEVNHELRERAYWASRDVVTA